MAEDDRAEVVEVEIRIWRADEPEYGTRISPVRMEARLADGEGGPMLVVEHPDGDRTAYTAAEAQEHAGTLLVMRAPTAEEVRLLEAAADAGFVVEPRVAGEPWRGIEEL